MEANRLDRVHIEVAENIVEITWDERDTLLVKLRDVAGCETIIERFWAVGRAGWSSSTKSSGRACA